MHIAALLFLATILTPSAPASPVQRDAPLIVFVAADQEYGSEETMPALAKALEKQFRFRTRVLKGFPDQSTTSAFLPTSREPILSSSPSDQAGLIVSHLIAISSVMGIPAASPAAIAFAAS